MSLHTLIAHGGRVLIAGGGPNDWAEFRQHPQLIFWTGDQKDILRNLKNNGNLLPDNVNGVVISRFIGHSTASLIIDSARRRRALIIPVKNTGEITKILTEIITVPPVDIKPEEDKKVMTPQATKSRDKLTPFLEKHHQTELYAAEEGRRLYKIAVEQGLKTTEGSLIQAVRKYRVKYGVNAPKQRTPKKPRSSEKKTKAPVSSHVAGLLNMIDELQTGLTLVREGVAKLDQDTSELATLKSKLAALLG